MTAPPRTVDLDPTDPAVSSVHRAALATVPRRFRVGGARPADVLVISGRPPDWPAAVTAAIDEGRRAIVLTRPGPAALPDIDAAADRAAQAGATVAVDTAYAGHRTWSEALPQLAADTAAASLLDSVISAPASSGGMVTALLDQLAVVRPMLDRPPSLELVHRSDGHYVAHGAVGRAAVNLVGLVSPGAEAYLRVDLVSPDRHWRIRFGPPDEAAPIDVVRYDAGGDAAWPATYQTSRRQLWIDLHATLTGSPSLGYPLAELAADAAVAEQLLGQSRRATRAR